MEESTVNKVLKTCQSERRNLRVYSIYCLCYKRTKTCPPQVYQPTAQVSSNGGGHMEEIKSTTLHDLLYDDRIKNPAVFPVSKNSNYHLKFSWTIIIQHKSLILPPLISIPDNLPTIKQELVT